MKETIKNNAPRVESNPVASENVKNVVINFESDESREAEARQLKSREAEADRAKKAREAASELMKSARDNFNAARESEAAANIAAARSRYAAGSDNASDRALLSIDALFNFSKGIFKAAEASRAAVEGSEAGKAADKAIRDENKKTSLSRALRDLVAMLNVYNAKFALFGFQLEASEATPALMKAEAVTPFLLAPTAEGTPKVAALKRGKLSVVTEWTAARVADILIDNVTIAAATEAAPRAALLEALNARDNVATLQSEADEIAATLKARRDRANGLNRTISNPRAKAETKARAAADLEALNAEISAYNAKLSKALEAVKEAKAKAAALRAAALEAAEIAPADLEAVEALRDAYNVAKAEAAEALRVAGLEVSRAVAFAAAEARKQKKSPKFDALKKADPRAVFAPAVADEIASQREALRAFAPADAEKAEAATREADAKAEAARVAMKAEADAIAASIKADPAAKYRALLDVACNAMKAAADAKAKKAKAADPVATPEISDREFIAIVEESDRAEAVEAAALEALNAAASEARAAAEASQPASPAADAGSQPAEAAAA